MSAWEQIKTLYKNEFNIPDIVVEYMGAECILEMCAGGISNINIAFEINTLVENVVKTIESFFDFKGWDVDLDINPYYIFNNHKDYTDFENNILILSKVTPKETILQAYKICIKLDNIKKEIDKYVL